MPLMIPRQATEEWFAARRGRITASVAAACVGRNEHMGLLAAYNTVMQLNKPKDSGMVRFGVEFEQRAISEYELRSEYLVERTGFWVHPVHYWLGASPDGFAGLQGMIEVKCPVKAPESIPDHHLVQCQIGLAVTFRKWCDYFAWTKERVFLERVYRLGMAEEDKLIAQLYDFYATYVLTKTPPKRQRRLKSGDQEPTADGDSEGRGDTGASRDAAGDDQPIPGEDGDGRGFPAA